MRVACGGCFNVIHLGHIYFLLEGKKRGDELWVILTNDKNNLKKNKQPAKVRERNLAILGIADRIVVGEENDYSLTISKIKPDLICLGWDQDLPERIKKYVKEKKIKIEKISQLHEYQKGAKQVIGKVVSGRGSASFFMGVNGYQKKMVEKTGHVFFPGTLNISLSVKDYYPFLSKEKELIISGFKKNKKEFNEIRLYPVILIKYLIEGGALKLPLEKYIKKQKAWVVIHKNSRYNPNIVEIIHPQNLRKKMALRDGDLVEVIF